MIVPVITGVTGTVTEGIKKDFEAIPGGSAIDSL